MLSFLRAPHPPRTNNADRDTVYYENGTSSVAYHRKDRPGGDYMMTHSFPPAHPQNGPSIIQPPFHWHISQTEKFFVSQGTAHMYYGLGSKPYATLSSHPTPGSKRSVTLPPFRYHRFANASSTEELRMNIQLDPEDYENEQRFFRNFFGYLDDCKRSRTAPSIFQLFVFLHSADVPLAIPLPNVPGAEFVGLYLSWALLIVVAYIGRVVLGYRQTYPEYYNSSKSK
ncbi:-like cupin [Lecanosticta acicola]|uniref:-like cupin n=1 Tax=Lecanosticta acicola TaxID=111012 RepID=A0AAI9ED95_9PEZI|nr:-like cupin [Lecanosticta acicola]